MNLWLCLKTALHNCSPSHLTELELFFVKEEWAKTHSRQCVKLAETLHRALSAVIAKKTWFDKVSNSKYMSHYAFILYINFLMRHFILTCHIKS